MIQRLICLSSVNAILTPPDTGHLKSGTAAFRWFNPVLIVLVLFLPSFMAGAVTQQWAKRYNVGSGEDRAVGVANDSAGNVYVTGYSQNGFNGGVSSYDWATVKYGPTGSQLWVKTYNGPGKKGEQPVAIKVDGSGRVYVTGSSYAFSTYGDIVTIKYDTNGNVLWSKTYNNSAYNYYDYPVAMAIDGTGNVYVLGVSANGIGYGDDYITIKYNASGIQQWAKRYNGSYGGNEYPTTIAVDGVGNVYVTGYSDGGSTKFDYLTVKYDAAGNQKWVKRYTGVDSTNGYYDRARAIAIDKDGNVIVTGQSGRASSGSSTGDYATVKYNSAGTQLWVKRFNGTGLSEDDAKALAVDASGNIVVTGWSISKFTGVSGYYRTYATVKYNPSGTQLWAQLYSGPGRVDQATAIALDATGNIYVTGSSRGASGSNTYDDYATIKYNASGALQWVARYNGLVTIYTQYDIPTAITVDAANNVYVTGYSDGGSTGYDYATIKYSQP